MSALHVHPFLLSNCAFRIPEVNHYRQQVHAVLDGLPPNSLSCSKDRAGTNAIANELLQQIVDRATSNFSTLNYIAENEVVRRTSLGLKDITVRINNNTNPSTPPRGRGGRGRGVGV